MQATATYRTYERERERERERAYELQDHAQQSDSTKSKIYKAACTNNAARTTTRH
jgi:hypothetical protein